MKHLAVLGAGSWGTALSIALAGQFESVRLWARDAAQASEMQEHRENRHYLPSFRLPAKIAVSSDAGMVLENAEVVLLVVPSAQLRAALETTGAFFPPCAVLVSATKGLEERSLCRMSEVIAESTALPVTVLSGPTFAREIATGEPAAVVLASTEIEVARTVQQAFSTPALRFYTSTDVAGVELGGALKNIIAIGAGVCHGLGLGSNSVAALVTRGLAEITRLAVKMGAEARTLSGLAGLGDLVLTATGDLSRNRWVGVQLGKNRTLDHILSELTQVAEGVTTCSAAYRLGRQFGVDLPITNQMYEVLQQGKNPRQAIRDLMERPLGSE